MSDTLYQTIPAWGAGVLLFMICVLAREAGALLYRWLAARQPPVLDNGKDVESHVIAAIFGLLAFVVGLSFSIAIDRFDTRRDLVVEETNAISTTYLRADLFDEPHRSRLQTTLRAYAHTRVAPNGQWDQRMETQLGQSLALQKRLWDETRAAVYPVRETELASYFLDAANEVLKVSERRQVAGSAHIPTRVLNILLLYLVAAAVVLGYLLGDRPRLKRQGTTVLLAFFSIMLMTVLDIDQPRAGAIKVPQKTLEDLTVRLDQDLPPVVRRPMTTAP